MQKGKSITHLVKKHKFWTSVIVLLIITIMVHAFGPSISLGSWRLSYLFFFGLLYHYTLVGGLIWSGYTRKKGMTMVTIGIFSALLSLHAWWTLLSHWDFEAIGFSMAVIFAFLSAFFIYFSVKRYRNWLQKYAYDASRPS